MKRFLALFFVLAAFNVASAQVMDTIQVGNSVMINFNYQSLDSILRSFETKFAVLEGNQDLDGDGIRQNEDCDDENFEVGAASIWYEDEDGDEYGGDNTTLSCTQPQGYVSISGDCDDSVETINPGASEICGDGIDQNCDNIFNDNPVISGVIISPNPVYVNSTATCSAQVSHTTALSINYEWRTNSTLLGTASSITLDPSMVSSGSTLKCTASATTSGGCSDTGSYTIVVENSLPSAPVVSLSPTNPVEGEDDLVAVISSSTDPDGDTVTYEYQWFVNGSAVGCSTDTFCVPTMATDVVQVTVTPNDGTGSGASGSASVVIVSAP